MDRRVIEPVETTDPVCGRDWTTGGRAGWRIDKPIETLEYEGHTYHFCSEACRLEFERHPLRYSWS